MTPARIAFDTDGTPTAPDFGDVYHARAGAEMQARHVFLAGNGLPERWRGRARFVVCETGFGLGNNFLATWAAWRDDAERCERLWFCSLDKHPPRLDDLRRAHAASPWPVLAHDLIAAWPPLTPDLHVLPFDDGRVMLLLRFADVSRALREFSFEADAFFLDGFAPARNPAMWDRHVFKALGRRAARGATAATWSVAREVRDGLALAGFDVRTAPGIGGKWENTVARYAPRGPAHPARAERPATAIVVGAGLAGAACAQALAREGVACRVLEALSAPAQGASGNPGGLCHGIVHADDGLHARFMRAAALYAACVYGPLISRGAVAGRLEGLLRLASAPGLASMRAALHALGLPPDYADAFDASQAAQRTGVPVDAPAWWLAQGGWIDPGAYVRHALGGPGIDVRTNAAVAALHDDGTAWTAFDAAGRTLARAEVAVVANAQAAAALLGTSSWPVEVHRGQLTRVPAATPGLRSPLVPLAGSGYALTLADGDVLCGATASQADDDPALRPADQRENLARLAALTGTVQSDIPLAGRVAWRCISRDRLPIAGAVPVEPCVPMPASTPRLRDMPRRPRLYVCTGLGSRGITWAPLLGLWMASLVCGSPVPLPRPLADAIDPARFAVRRSRKA